MECRRNLRADGRCVIEEDCVCLLTVDYHPPHYPHRSQASYTQYTSPSSGFSCFPPSPPHLFKSRSQAGQIHHTELTAPLLQTEHELGHQRDFCSPTRSLKKKKVFTFYSIFAEKVFACKLSLSGFLGCKTAHTVPL